VPCVFFLLEFGARCVDPALLQALPVLLPRALMRKTLNYKGNSPRKSKTPSIAPSCPRRNLRIALAGAVALGFRVPEHVRRPDKQQAFLRLPLDDLG